MPRMTSAQRTGISTPAAGLQVYDTTTKSHWYHDGAKWVESAEISISGGANLYITAVNTATGTVTTFNTLHGNAVTPSTNGSFTVARTGTYVLVMHSSADGDVAGTQCRVGLNDGGIGGFRSTAYHNTYSNDPFENASSTQLITFDSTKTYTLNLGGGIAAHAGCLLQTNQDARNLGTYITVYYLGK